MFRVVGDKIYFMQWLVARIDPWVRESVRMDLVSELENHVSNENIERLKARLASLQTEIYAEDANEILRAILW